MKKTITIFTLIAILIVSLFTMTGCGDEEKTSKKKKSEESNEIINNTTNELMNNTTNSLAGNTTNNLVGNTTNETGKNTTTQSKPIDKTPININESSSYFFVVKGKKYSSGDKISELTASDFSFNKTGSEKEIPANGYLIGGGSVLNSEKRTVFSITPYNNTSAKIKGADAVIGGFSLNKSGYDYLSGDIEIYGGITIGTSMEDVKAVFGEPTKTTEATEYAGPTYTYDAEARYRSFTFNFDKEEKVKSISWENFTF